MPFNQAFRFGRLKVNFNLILFLLQFDSFWLAWSLAVTCFNLDSTHFNWISVDDKAEPRLSNYTCHWWLGKVMLSNNFHATGRGSGVYARPSHSSSTLAQTASRPKDQVLGALSIIQVWHSLQCKARSLQLLFQPQLSPHTDLKSTWQGLYRVSAGSW